MNHTIMPGIAQGQPIPLVKLGQGRCDEHESGPLETVQTFAAKLRAAGYQEPVLPKTVMAEMLERRAAGLAEKAEAELPPVVSREGFRAGVLSAIAGGLIIAGVYLVWGLFTACLFAAVCVGFVAGALVMQEWE